MGQKDPLRLLMCEKYFDPLKVQTDLIERSRFNPHPGHVVASLDKTLYNNYFFMMASNKQQIQWARISTNLQEHWINRNS